MNREKREPTKGKWAKGLNSVTGKKKKKKKKKAVVMNPVLRKGVQTMTKKATAGCRHSQQIAAS